MQFKLFIAALFSTATLVAGQTTLSPAQSSKIVADIGKYESSVAAQPAFTSVSMILATAVPTSLQGLLSTNPGLFYTQLATQTAAPAWYTALPSDVQNYLSSVANAEVSIVQSDLKAAAPTHGAMKVAGAALAVGAAGLAML